MYRSKALYSRYFATPVENFLITAILFYDYLMLLTHSPGDTISVHWRNEDSMVEALLKHLKLEPETVVKITVSENNPIVSHLATVPESGISLRELFCNLDITSFPSQDMLQMLASFTSDAGEKDSLLRLAQQSESDSSLNSRKSSLVDILEQFPSCQPPLEQVRKKKMESHIP